MFVSEIILNLPENFFILSLLNIQIKMIQDNKIFLTSFNWEENHKKMSSIIRDSWFLNNVYIITFVWDLHIT